jgi:polar amino acid transport system substrate-binding protein
MQTVKYLALVLLSVKLSVAIAPVNAKVPLRLVALEFRPFIWCEQKVAKGIDADILAELFERMDADYTIECLPWKRAIHYVKTGLADGLFSAYNTKERESFADYLSLPLHYSVFTAFVHENNPQPNWDLNAFLGSRISINLGYSINDRFDSAKTSGNITVYEFGNTRSNILMLVNNRSDVYINDIDVVRYEAKQLEVGNKIKALTPPVNKPKPAFLILSKAASIKNRTIIIESLNSALKSMWDDGTIDTITSSYLFP